MRFTPVSAASEAARKRSFQRRLLIIQSILGTALLVIAARLIELQVLKGDTYAAAARDQHFGGITLPAKRGEIFLKSSRTGEESIVATNTTLNLLYVDPLIADKETTASVLSRLLLTPKRDAFCRRGGRECPREFRSLYAPAFDPLSGANGALTISPLEVLQEQWKRNTLQRIDQEFVTFIPLLYSSTRPQRQQVRALGIPGIEAREEDGLIYADPTAVPERERHRVARILSPLLELDRQLIAERLRQRRLRYVPILRRLSSQESQAIRDEKLQSLEATEERRRELLTRGREEEAERVADPLRGIVLLPEHWRYYPEGSLAAQVIGFLDLNGQAQYGIERMFSGILRGEEGKIRTVIDPFGGQIVSEEQSVVQARDGDSIVLTIDRFIQKFTEDALARAVEASDADSGQVIILDPTTGRVLALANAPLFDPNDYASVYLREPIPLPPERTREIVAEIYHPLTNALVVRAYLPDLSPEGRKTFNPALQEKLRTLEATYDLEDFTRTYLYIGEHNRQEVFPGPNDTWLTYRNRIGAGAYINRAIQEIYEPGSVFKPLTMATALDQSEVQPEDTYDDTGPVKVDEYTIRNAENLNYDTVTMVQCLQFSINTCMTSVSKKLGKKLFSSYIDRFGFTKLTGIQLENEVVGQVLPWRQWSDALLATASYGQGISMSPIQMVTAFATLANNGKLMKPNIVDRFLHADGTTESIASHMVEQVITPDTAATITAMLVSSVNEGYAKQARIPGYLVAGKTGTSQIAGPGGKYETGSGSTIHSFAGYAPADHPRFVMLVKLDRPRRFQYSTRTASPLFKEIAAFLLDYYAVPPRK